MTADVINGAFEALAGFMIMNHCTVLFRQKQVRGVSVFSTAFFAAWGVWNLYYYPSLGQIYSFLGGILVVSFNVLWVIMMVYYVRKERKNEKAIP